MSENKKDYWKMIQKLAEYIWVRDCAWRDRVNDWEKASGYIE